MHVSTYTVFPFRDANMFPESAVPISCKLIRDVCECLELVVETSPVAGLVSRAGQARPLFRSYHHLFRDHTRPPLNTHDLHNRHFSKNQRLTPSTNMRTDMYCEHDDCMGKSFYYARNFSGNLGFCIRTRSDCECTLGMSGRGDVTESCQRTN